MGSVMSFFSAQTSKEDMEAALQKAKEIVASNPVVVFRFFFPFASNKIKKKKKFFHFTQSLVDSPLDFAIDPYVMAQYQT